MANSQNPRAPLIGDAIFTPDHGIGLPGLPVQPSAPQPGFIPGNPLSPGWPSNPFEVPRGFPGAPVPGGIAPSPMPFMPQLPHLPQRPAANPLEEFFIRHINKETPMTRQLPANVQALLAKPVSYFKEQSSNGDTASAPLTNVAFVLDGSTSMQDGKEATVEGFNAQVAVVKEGAKAAGNTTFTDVRFNTTVDLRSVAGSLDAMKPLTYADYDTNGWTALYDALGFTIAALLNTTGIDNPNTATLITVFTDGDENKSRVYDAATLRALIERLEATGRWTFALVGPLQSVTGLASILSVKHSNIAGFDVGSVDDKRKAFRKVATASASYMSMRSMGSTQSNALYDDEDLKKR